MPVRSKKQWKWMFASGQPFAERWADETPGGRVTRFRRLPERTAKAEPLDAPPWAWAVKHGAHDQSSHGRRTARRGASQSAYRGARAGGASPQEARAVARDASEVFAARQRLANIEKQLSGTVTERTRASLEAERARLTQDIDSRVSRLRSAPSQAMAGGVGDAVYQARNAPVAPTVIGRRNTVVERAQATQAAQVAQTRQAAQALASQHGLPAGSSRYLEMMGNDPQIAQIAGQLHAANAKLRKRDQPFRITDEAGAVAIATQIARQYGSIEAAMSDPQLGGLLPLLTQATRPARRSTKGADLAALVLELDLLELGGTAKAEPAENAASGAPRKKMTPAEVARHAALVRWKKKNPLMARQMAIREKRKAKGGGGGAKPEQPAAAPPANGDERTKFLADLGLDANTAEALSEYLGGLADGEEMALNAQAAEALQAMGLATMREGDGPNRGIDLTPAGKKLQAAVAKGDTAAASALVEKAHARAKPKGEAGAAAPDKEEKPKGGGGGGGGGGKEEPKPEADKDAAKEQERAARAAETGGKVGLAPDAVDELRAAAESGGVQNEKLIELGLVGEDGTTTDQGRRALSALERGDVRGYRAALQDVEAARGRAKAKADKDAAREGERTARETEQETARAAREQERTDTDAAREKAKADAEAQELDDIADDYRRGRRGLSFKEQRRLIRAGRARMNGEKFELKAAALTLELDLLELSL